MTFGFHLADELKNYLNRLDKRIPGYDLRADMDMQAGDFDVFEFCLLFE